MISIKGNNVVEYNTVPGAEPVAHALPSTQDAVTDYTPDDDDTYYNNEPDLVTVIDIDNNAVFWYQFSKVIKLLLLAVVWIAFVFVMHDDDMTFVTVTLCFTLPTFFLFLVTLITAKRAKAASNVGIHMCVTSQCIKYDQTSPDVHVVIPLSNISHCTTLQKDFKQWGVVGKSITVNIVIFHLKGGKPKCYAGIRDTQALLRVITSMLHPKPADTVIPVAQVTLEGTTQIENNTSSAI